MIKIINGEVPCCVYVSEVPNHLAFLSGSLTDNYLRDMRIAQEFAVMNRDFMARRIISQLNIKGKTPMFETIHHKVQC